MQISRQHLVAAREDAKAEDEKEAVNPLCVSGKVTCPGEWQQGGSEQNKTLC